MEITIIKPVKSSAITALFGANLEYQAGKVGRYPGVTSHRCPLYELALHSSFNFVFNFAGNLQND